MMFMRRMAMKVHPSTRGEHVLPKLPYDYKALEPIIKAEIMELHHGKHHQAYVNNFNAALKQFDEAKKKDDFVKIVSLQSAINFNGGGHVNHSIFWQNLTPDKCEPTNELMCGIEKDFISIGHLKKELSALATSIQGSGWAWLGYNRKSWQMELVSMRNQDSLQAATGIIPLFGIDVWEHAYYLQYKNNRAAYTEAIWDIANWVDISKRYKAASTVDDKGTNCP